MKNVEGKGLTDAVTVQRDIGFSEVEVAFDLLSHCLNLHYHNSFQVRFARLTPILLKVLSKDPVPNPATAMAMMNLVGFG